MAGKNCKCEEGEKNSLREKQLLERLSNEHSELIWKKVEKCDKV